MYFLKKVCFFLNSQTPFRAPRNRTADEIIPRRSKTPVNLRPECVSTIDPYSPPSTKMPSSVPIKSCNSFALTPNKESPCVKRLKAISTESLRSVSPGSDSVFYSEADTLVDHQVHCHNCGKQVEIITALSGSDDTVVGVEDVIAPIVQPPADFADSPKAPRPNVVSTHHTTRLYKKMDKRFRSEERQGERRTYRNRQENARAKVSK